MDRLEVEVIVATPPERAFALWVDGGRFAQWQRAPQAITDVSGPLDEPGATYMLRAGPRMEMRVEVLEVVPGRLHRTRATALRTTQTEEAHFEPHALGTRLRVKAELEVAWGVFSHISEGLNRGNFRRVVRREVENFKAFAERPEAKAEAGAWYSLDDGGGHFRLGQALAVDEAVVHLRLRPGTFRIRPRSLDAVPAGRPTLRDAADFQPLGPSLRASARVLQAGQQLLLLDGGLGLAHLPLSTGAFSDAQPELIGVEPVAEDSLASVEGWWRAGGPVFGPDIGLRLTPLVSLENEDGSFGVAKILVATWRTVHLRVYADTWPVRPVHVDPWSLGLASVDIERTGEPTYRLGPATEVGHLSLDGAAYLQREPQFIQLAILQPDELDGYRSGRRQGGGPSVDRHEVSTTRSPPEDPLDLLPREATGFIRTAYLPATEPADFGGSSGFGGQPFLPDGASHPVCPRCNRPISLLAQLAIDELPRDGRPLGSGLLQVFYCTTGLTDGGTDDGMPCDVALDGWAPFSKAHVVRLVSADGSGQPSAAGTPCSARRVVSWGAVRECPNGEELGGLGVEIEDAVGDALVDAGIPRGGEKLGGWPAWVQGVEYPTCPRCGTTMRYVLQIDSEDNVPVMFGDVGTGHVTQCPKHPEVLAFGWACS